MSTNKKILLFLVAFFSLSINVFAKCSDYNPKQPSTIVPLNDKFEPENGVGLDGMEKCKAASEDGYKCHVVAPENQRTLADDGKYYSQVFVCEPSNVKMEGDRTDYEAGACSDADESKCKLIIDGARHCIYEDGECKKGDIADRKTLKVVYKYGGPGTRMKVDDSRLMCSDFTEVDDLYNSCELFSIKREDGTYKDCYYYMWYPPTILSVADGNRAFCLDDVTASSIKTPNVWDEDYPQKLDDYEREELDKLLDNVKEAGDDKDKKAEAEKALEEFNKTMKGGQPLWKKGEPTYLTPEEQEKFTPKRVTKGDDDCDAECQCKKIEKYGLVKWKDGECKDIIVGEDVCTDDGVEVRIVLRVFGYLLLIARVTIPLLLIGFGTFDLYKAVVDSDENSLRKQVRKLIIRVIAGLIVFFLPNIVFGVHAIFSSSSTSNLSKFNCITICILKPSSCSVNKPIKTESTSTESESSSSTEESESEYEQNYISSNYSSHSSGGRSFSGGGGNF